MRDTAVEPKIPAMGTPPVSYLARERLLVRCLKVLYKRRWLVGGVFVTVFAVAVTDTLTATRVYEARARLLIEPGEQHILKKVRPVVNDSARRDYFLTQYSLLRSRDLAARALEAMNAWETPHFAGGRSRGTFSLRRTLTALPSKAVSFLLGNEQSRDARRATSETRRQSNAVTAFLARLRINPIFKSWLVDLRFRDADPDVATAAVNALAEAYIAHSLESRFLASQEATEWLNERIAEQRTAVAAEQAALQDYRERNGAISSDESGDLVVQQLFDLNAALTRAKTTRLEKQALYNQLAASQSDPGTRDSFPAILSNRFIQQQKSELAVMLQRRAQLAEKLGERHPQMREIGAAIERAQARMEEEIGRVIEAVRAEYESALALEARLTTTLTEQRRQALAMNRRSINYEVLRRDLESTREVYDVLTRRAKETELIGALQSTNIRIVDPAERPREPVLPDVRADLAVGFLMALLLAFGSALLVEHFDSRIKTPDDIPTHLRLPWLGMLPLVAKRDLTHVQMKADVPAGFAESFRALRTNVLFATADVTCRIVMVTSTGPGEGKSTVASHLAVGLAEAGQRVLLVDADMRKPRVHELFGIPQEPGLSNFLVGLTGEREIFRAGPADGLQVVTAGHISPNAAELAGTPRFRGFLESQAVDFDWIVIDVPPVMAVTDAAVVARLATGVLFVVGSEMTSRYAAKTAIARLHQVGARLLGAVLNRVALERDPYYYSGYYRREYAQYYAASPESARQGGEALSNT